MKENDIRPENLLKKHDELHALDVEDLMKLKNNFVNVNCPGCAKNKSRFVFSKKGFDFLRCLNCDTFYINPRPTQDMLADFYINSRSMKLWNDSIFPATEHYRKDYIFRKRADRVIEFCQKYCNRFEKLVDVGAGTGLFCQVIKDSEIFREIIAIEPSEGLAHTCKQKGITTIEKPIEDVEISNVDVITSFEVIEHLFDPGHFVKACYDVLPKGGLFILTTPNIEGFEMSMLLTLDPEKETPNIGGPNHLNYYSPDSLKFFLERHGFKVLEITTPGELDVDLVKKKLTTGEYDFSNIPILNKILNNETLSENFQKFLADNDLSSHMWAVSQKF